MSDVIRKSQTPNRVAIPYGMLDELTAALGASGIEVTNVIRRPYVQLPPETREDVMADLDAANVNGRRLVIEAAGNADDMRAFVRGRLSPYARSEQVGVESIPCDKAHARNTIYSELIDCYYDSVARGNSEAAAEEREMLRNMWAEYEQTVTAAIDYARKTDDIANDLAFTSMLSDTRRRLRDLGILDIAES